MRFFLACHVGGVLEPDLKNMVATWDANPLVLNPPYRLTPLRGFLVVRRELLLCLLILIICEDRHTTSGCLSQL